MDTGETVTVYRSSGCSGCPFKTDCIRGNNCKTPMEDRQKVLYVSKKMKEKRQETIKRITSDYGTQLRMNRSIQVEGSFANLKEDMEFRRYLYRGNANVTAQSVLLAIGYNINKLHHKIQAGRTGQHLFPLKQPPDFESSKVNPANEPFSRKGLLKFAFLKK